MASFDDNSEFMISMLRECGLAHKTTIFVLDEFDLFAQGRQRLLHGLIDAMQSVTSQAVVVGVSCRLDADQILEKRVRSRFSHRKIMFLPSSVEELLRLVLTNKEIFVLVWWILLRENQIPSQSICESLWESGVWRIMHNFLHLWRIYEDLGINEEETHQQKLIGAIQDFVEL